MQIIDLKLENYQGIKGAEFNFNGKNAKIFGENGTGKTTILNSHCWLLFGRSGSGIKGYTPQTTDETGGYKHNLGHAAEVLMQLDDGRLVSYRKVFHELYTKKQGTALTITDRNTIDYFINGVPSKEKEYEASITENLRASADQLKILTIPEYFSTELKWEECRAILMTLCEPITDEQVISSKSELAELPELLKIPGSSQQSYTIDDYKKIAAARKTIITEKLDKIPDRIDEAEKAKPDTTGFKPDVIKENLANHRATKSAMEKKLAESNLPNAAEQKKRVALQKAEADLNEAMSKYFQETNRAHEANARKVRNLQDEAATTTLEISKKQTALAAAQDKLTKMIARRSELLQQYEKESQVAWDESQTVCCPTCKRELPVKDREKVREEFNLAKSKKLESIRAAGKSEASADMITDLQNTISNSQKIIESLTNKSADLAKQIETAKAEYIDTPFDNTEECKRLTLAIADLKSKEITATSTTIIDTGIENSIKSFEEAIKVCEKKLADIDAAEKQNTRIKELEDEQKTLAAEDAKITRGLFLCKQFTQQRAKMLTEPINDKFKTVSFRLFTTQLNEGFKETCEVMIPSPEGSLVPYAKANDAAKVNAGIEIISVLSKHWNMTVPLFIDNAERITHITPTDTQTIQLIVSGQDENLRMVREGEKGWTTDLNEISE